MRARARRGLAAAFAGALAVAGCGGASAPVDDHAHRDAASSPAPDVAASPTVFDARSPMTAATDAMAPVAEGGGATDALDPGVARMPADSGGAAGSGGIAGISGDDVVGDSRADESLDVVPVHLRWDADGVERLGGGGWAVVTDRGYRVEVERAWLVTFSAALRACPEPAGWWPDWLLARAYAGHGDTGEDPTLTARFVEDLAALDDAVAGELTVPVGRWCEAHVAVGRSLRPVRGAAAPVDMVGRALYLEARWVAPDGRSGDLLVDTDLGHGAAAALAPAALAVPSPDGASAALVLTRDPSRLFDGLDLANAPPAVVGWSMLVALSAGLQAEIRPSSP